jgi:GrpB-like predicted nucleotidyltransferase (UPF0157 family)
VLAYETLKSGISHPLVMREYEELKKNLATQHTHDREQYTDAPDFSVRHYKFVPQLLMRLFVC